MELSPAMLLKSQLFYMPRSLKALDEHPLLETFFMCLIVVNAGLMALEVQYNGVDQGFIMGYPGIDHNAEDSYPGMAFLFESFAIFAGFCFFTEVVLKILAQRLRFVRGAWNIFDFTLVFLWIADYWQLADMGLNPMILRLARLAKVMRAVRVVKFMTAVDTLQLLLSSIQASGSILTWSTLILTLIMVVCAMCLNYALVDFIADPAVAPATRNKVYRVFGTFTRSMLTMFEVTLGNWVPVCRLLVDEVSEWYSMVFIVYKITVGFAVVKVITGVFMHETFKVASTDDELMIMQKQRLVEKHEKKMKVFFAQADHEGDGTITRDEFREVMRDKRVKTWLSAMELDVRDPDMIFHLMDDDTSGPNVDKQEQGPDHCEEEAVLTVKEVVQGVAALKGAARSVDMQVLMKRAEDIQNRLKMLAANGLGSGTSASNGFNDARSEMSNELIMSTRESRAMLVAMQRQLTDLASAVQGTTQREPLSHAEYSHRNDAGVGHASLRSRNGHRSG